MWKLFENRLSFSKLHALIHQYSTFSFSVVEDKIYVNTKGFGMIKSVLRSTRLSGEKDFTDEMERRSVRNKALVVLWDDIYIKYSM